MSTVSGTKLYGSNGLSGLVSGLDTESMVQSMLSGTQSKIDTQYGKKQQLEWKQEIYRDIISDLRAFQTKFFSYSNPTTNILSNSFFNSLTSSVGSSTAIKVSASSSATTGKTTIDKVLQLATATKKTSGATVSGKVEGTLDLSKIKSGAKVTIKIGTTEQEIDLDASSNEALLTSINAKISADGTASIVNGKLTIEAKTAGNEISISGSSDGLAVLGLSKSITVKDKFDTTHDLSKGVPYINIKMDGVEKRVLIDFDYHKDPNKFVEGLNKKIESTIGTGLKASLDGGKIKFTAEKGREVTLTGGSALGGLGIEAGTSNKISLGTKLRDVNFAEPLQGDTFVFKINGKTFAFSGEDSLRNIMEKVNTSDAGVTMSYSSSQDKFVIESKTSGKGIDIEMSQSTGNLLTCMFGVGASGNVAGSQLKKETITATNGADFTGITKGDVKLVVNGTTITLSLPEKKNDDGTLKEYTKDEVISELNKQLSDRVSVGHIKFVEDASGKMTLQTSSQWNVSFPSTVEAGSLGAKLGFEANQSTKVDKDSTLTELGLKGSINVGGTTIDLSTIDTIEALAGKINTALGGDGKCTFEESTGTLMIMNATAAITFNADNADGQASLKKLFGSESMTIQPPGVSSVPSAVTVDGKNAILSINGVEVEKNTNAFTVDGLDIELKETTDTALTIETTRNTEQITKGIEEFVSEYNKVIEKLNGLLNEKADYKEYPPLTDEQRAEMSDKQIELWEEKAKKGLVRNDSTVRGLLQEMRNILYEKPAGGQLALYDIGIETSKEYKDYGKLIIKDSAKLKNAIETNATEVQKLFTSDTDGLAVKFNKALDNAVKASSASPGSLVSIAGIKGGTLDGKDAISQQIDDVKDNITSLKNKYDMEKTRYWKQFNAMEKLIQQMNQQSSWLTQQFS